MDSNNQNIINYLTPIDLSLKDRILEVLNMQHGNKISINDFVIHIYKCKVLYTLNVIINNVAYKLYSSKKYDSGYAVYDEINNSIINLM